MSKKDRLLENEGYIEDLLTRYNYGDLIRIGYFERLFGVNKDESEYVRKFAVLKESLIEWGVVLKSVLGEGYRILHPREVPAEVYRSYAQSGLRRFHRGIHILSKIDRQLLTAEEEEQVKALDKALGIMLKDGENTLLTAQALIGDTKRKELGN